MSRKNVKIATICSQRKDSSLVRILRNINKKSFRLKRHLGTNFCFKLIVFHLPIVEEFSERKIVNGVFYLQDLPTALKVAKDGDKICLKSGNYILNKITETLKKSVQLNGEGHDKTTISILGLYFVLNLKHQICSSVWFTEFFL